MNARDITILALSSALLGGVVVRAVAPPTPPTRQLSIEGIEIKNAQIRSGEVLIQEATWTPPSDVYVVGWAPSPGAVDARPDLFLMSGAIAIFMAERGSTNGPRPAFFPSGTGFLVRKGELVTLRLRIDNSGPDGESLGARALLYFHPVAWR